MSMAASTPYFWRLVVLASVLAAGTVWSSGSAQSASDVPIEILVLPATPAAAETGPTVSALLLGGAPEPVEGVETPWLDLMVTDDQGVPDGWTVKIMAPPPADPEQVYLLNRYLRRVEPGDHHLADGPHAPRGDVLSVGQPLDQMTSVIVAEPGAGAGTYRIRFEIAGHVQGSAPPSRLIVCVTAAP